MSKSLKQRVVSIKVKELAWAIAAGWGEQSATVILDGSGATNASQAGFGLTRESHGLYANANWQRFILCAELALFELKRVNEDMVRGALASAHDMNMKPVTTPQEAAQVMFHAMIDGAMKEPTDG